MGQEAIVRDIVSTTITGAEDRDLTDHDRREKLKKKVLASIKKSTDVHANEILMTDLVVQ